jgi:hypothetical protein
MVELPKGLAEWFSRGVAVSLLILVPGLIGGWADSQFGTGWMTPLGFLVGMLAGLAGLIGLLNRRPSAVPREDSAPADGLERWGGSDGRGSDE